MKPTRLVIYPKDVQAITGKSYSYALDLLNAARKRFNKEPSHLITIDEFCTFMGLEQKKVEAFLFES